jgi:hypothetical protein
MNKEAWQNEAETHVRNLAASGLIFTSNEVWDTGLQQPENLRWLGPVMRRLQSQGVIVKVGEGVLSERGHGSRMNAAWQGSVA